MEDIRQAIGKASAVRVYRDGKIFEFAAGSSAFSALYAAWERMTDAALLMPAFGVSMDALTRKEREQGTWVEFCFADELECGGMPFDRLLIGVLPEYRGFNLIRRSGGEYTGRCFYLDLREGTMQELYAAALAMEQK